MALLLSGSYLINTTQVFDTKNQANLSLLCDKISKIVVFKMLQLRINKHPQCFSFDFCTRRHISILREGFWFI